MTDTISSSVCQVEDLPPTLRADLSAPELQRGGWLWKIGPAFAGLFIWVPLLDPVGALVLGDASLVRLGATAALAALACHALLYAVPAMTGWKTGRRSSLVAASTFGTKGADLLVGLAVGLAAIVLQAVSIFVSMHMVLLGLVSFGLVAPAALALWQIGELTLVSPVMLLTAAFWIFITNMASLLRLVGVVGAMMQVYTPLALVLLGAGALLLSPGLDGFEQVRQAALSGKAGPSPALGAAPRLFQLVFAAFALSGLQSVDWGMTVEHRRDIRIGGWMAIVLAGSFGLIMALLTVAGAIGVLGSGLAAGRTDGLTAEPLFHRALYLGLPGFTGGFLLVLMGLAGVAPACYAAWISSHRFVERWPGPRRRGWTAILAVPVFLLIISRWAGHLETTLSLLGGVFAPVVGAMVGDALMHNRTWPGIRLGWYLPGVLAWALGAVIGLMPVLGPAVGWNAAASLQPAALFAFLASACAFAVLARALTRPSLTRLPEVDSSANAPIAKG